MVRVLDAKSMRRHAASCSVAAVLVLVSLTAFAAGDDSDERRMQAQALHEQGQSLAPTDPKGALAALRLSYEIKADFRVLYSIGKVCVRLGDNACAVRSFEQYLKDGGAEISAKRKKEVEGELKSLSARATATATALTIKSSISGAYVKIDGVVIGRTPLPQPVQVKEGSHKVVLVADGNVTEKTVKVTTGSNETVDFDAKKEEPAPVVAPAPATPATAAHPPAAAPTSAPAPAPASAPASASAPSQPSAKRQIPLLPWIITGAFAAGTAVAGVLTLNASSDYDAMRDDYPITKDALDSAHSKGRNLLFLTGALGTATAVSLGVAAYFTFFRGTAAPTDKTIGKATASTGGFRSLGFAVSPAGFTIMGRLP